MMISDIKPPYAANSDTILDLEELNTPRPSSDALMTNRSWKLFREILANQLLVKMRKKWQVNICKLVVYTQYDI